MTITALLARPALPVPTASPAAQQKLLMWTHPEMNIFKQKQRFKLLGDYLSKKTGVRWSSPS